MNPEYHHTNKVEASEPVAFSAEMIDAIYQHPHEFKTDKAALQSLVFSMTREVYQQDSNKDTTSIKAAWDQLRQQRQRPEAGKA